MPRPFAESALNTPNPTTEPISDQGHESSFVEEIWFEHHVGDTVPLAKHNYLLQHKIAAGGMGEVWLAKRDDGLEVVIKCILPTLSSRDAQEIVERFIQEGLALEEMDSRHFPIFYETNKEGTVIAMERLHGVDLDRLLQDSDMSVLDAALIAEEVADGMEKAHGKGMIHRDIKPSNIFIEDKTDAVKILDFGIVYFSDYRQATKPRGTRGRITAPGMMHGTVEYVAPEVVRGKKPTTAMDVYALGATLYEMLCGKSPYNYVYDAWRQRPGVNVLQARTAVLEAILKGVYVPLGSQRADIPNTILILVERMMNPDPELRPSMADVRDILRKFTDTRQGIHDSSLLEEVE